MSKYIVQLFLDADNCTSMPCMNGATCINLLADFRCDCVQGWSGQLCDDGM